jgi:hypothetical protein
VIRAALRKKGWVEKKFHFMPKILSNIEDEVVAGRVSETPRPG